MYEASQKGVACGTNLDISACFFLLLEALVSVAMAFFFPLISLLCLVILQVVSTTGTTLSNCGNGRLIRQM